MATVPSDATHGVQSSFRELNEELRKLRSELAQINTEVIRKKVEDAEKDIRELKSLQRIPAYGQRAQTGIGPLFLNDRLFWESPTEEVAIRGPITASAAVDASDFIILVDCTAGNVTLTLPAASLKKGRMIEIKKIDSTVNKVIITAAGADLIDGFATQELLSQYEAAPIASDGVSNWRVL